MLGRVLFNTIQDYNIWDVCRDVMGRVRNNNFGLKLGTYFKLFFSNTWHMH